MKLYIVLFINALLYSHVIAQNPSYSISNTTKNKDIEINRYSQYYTYYDSIYGSNQALFSGLKYYPKQSIYQGHPFFKSNEPVLCKLKYKNKIYNSVLLKYDIHNQEILIHHVNNINTEHYIILNNQVIDTIWFDNILMVKNPYPEIKTQFLQVIYQGKISCYFAWGKDFNFYNTAIYTGYKYSNDLKNSYIYFQGKLVKYTNNRSFLSQFDKETKLKIKKYINKHKIRLKNASDLECFNLIKYCNSIY